MNLADFEQTGDRAAPRFLARVPDVGGTEEFELTLAGPAKAVKQMLAEAKIDLTIDSQRSQDQLLGDFETAQEQQRKSLWELAALEDIDALLKADPKRLQRDTTVFAAARPVAGAGTPFAFTISGFFVPAGVSLVFFGPLVLAAFATVLPATGDQDLFLRLFAPTGPTVSSSRAAGTGLDVVAFGMPFFPWVPCFQVFGFSAGICSLFSAHGV